MRRSFALYWLLPVIVVLAVGTLTVSSLPVGVLHDDAMYVILAKSIATGHGYRYLNLPTEPGATHFPPGYPAFLALLWKAFPEFPHNVSAFKFANVALLAASFALLARYIARRFSVEAGVAGLLAVVATLGVPSLLLSGLVLSEPLFLVLVIWALLVAEDYTSRDVSIGRVAALGLLCGVATLVRSTGIALLVATIMQLFLRRRWRDAAVTGLAALVVLVPWQLWTKAHGHDVPAALQGAYGPYADWVGQALRREGIGLIARTIGQTSRQTADLIIDMVCPFPIAAGRTAAAIIIAIFAAVGARRMWRLAPVTLWFLAGYVALILIWPVPPTRYVWGIWPLLLLLPGLAVAEILAWRPSVAPLRAARVGLLGYGFVATLGYVAYTVIGYRQQQWHSIPMQAGVMLRPVVLSVRSHVGENETAAVTAEGAVYLYSGRHSVPMYSYEVEHFFRTPTVEEEADAIAAISAAYHVDAVVTSTALQEAAVRSLQRSGRQALTLRDSTPGVLVFSRAKP